MLEQHKIKKMKTLKINRIMLLLMGLVVFNGCVDNDDFNTPDISIDEPDIPESALVQISSVAGQLAQEQDNSSLDYGDEDSTYSYVFSETDQFMIGYVVSTDEGGNFFEEIVIQDKPENRQARIYRQRDRGSEIRLRTLPAP